jgi:hypothetical protein
MMDEYNWAKLSTFRGRIMAAVFLLNALPIFLNVAHIINIYPKLLKGKSRLNNFQTNKVKYQNPHSLG